MLQIHEAHWSYACAARISHDLVSVSGIIELEQMMRSFLAEQRQRQRPPQRQRPARRPRRLERRGVFLLWEVGSCSNTMPELEWLISVYAARMAGREDARWVYYDPTSGGNWPPAGGKRRLIREEGLASRVSSHVRPRDPGGGTVPTVSPRRMTIADVSHTMELSGGGGLSWSPPGFRQCGPRRPWLGTLLDGSVLMMMLEYDHRWAQWGCLMIKCLLRTLSCRKGEGRRPSPVLPGAFFGEVSSCACTTWWWTSVWLLAGSGGHFWTEVSSCWAESATAEWRVWVAQRSWVALYGEMLTSLEVTGNVLPVVPAGAPAGAVNPAGPDGPVVAGGPVGLCETPSPSSCGVLEPLEHSVLNHADPAGQHAAVGTLSPSDCHHAVEYGCPYIYVIYWFTIVGKKLTMVLSRVSVV